MVEMQLGIRLAYVLGGVRGCEERGANLFGPDVLISLYRKFSNRSAI
jgi:hypothetical protein